MFTLQQTTGESAQACRHVMFRALLLLGALVTFHGSLLAQFEADNKNGELKPGDYSDVQLDIQVDPHRVTIPATALIFRSHGPQVAVLGADARVHLRKVHVALDLGTTLQIDQGLNPADRVIENPPDSLMDGDQVRVQSDNDENVAMEGGHASAG